MHPYPIRRGPACVAFSELAFAEVRSRHACLRWLGSTIGCYRAFTQWMGWVPARHAGLSICAVAIKAGP
jgi:hypothetical protein